MAIHFCKSAPGASWSLRGVGQINTGAVAALQHTVGSGTRTRLRYPLAPARCTGRIYRTGTRITWYLSIYKYQVYKAPCTSTSVYTNIYNILIRFTNIFYVQ